MSNSNTQIEFPQPMVEAPRYQTDYWYVHKGEVYSDTWGTALSKGGHPAELVALARFELYATAEACAQRIAYDAQQMRRLVIPAWFRALGPDVEYFWDGDGKWHPHTSTQGLDWRIVDPKNFRSKPRDVVVTVNGVEYRWPQTVKKGEPAGPRYIVHGVENVGQWSRVDMYGENVHHTRAGAESQLAAIRAAAGVES